MNHSGSIDDLYDQNAYFLLYRAVKIIPTSHYILGFVCFSVVFLYNFLEIHFLEDVFTGFRGSPVMLTYNSCSHIYEGVVSKCRILHGRYMATMWLSSPHIQTTFLNFFGNPPVFSYRRKLFHASDGGTFALDWLLSSDVQRGSVYRSNTVSKSDTTPIIVIIPGLTSDSNSPYMKHVVYNTAKCGWNVVVSNHRGLGGVSVTSDCFYNAGWTEDTRDVINYLHNEYPEAPLFAIGTSIGANILVKYLGEDGENVPIAGAAAICNPWDLLIGDRFICRRLVQKFYDRALTIGLQGYAQLHQPQYSRLANWDGIVKSRSIRDFDNHATCHVGKFETVDSYYRRCSSASYVENVSIPLLCISALDDPVCTREAIPWDECRANKNIVLATTRHGGHLGIFEGISATSLWWVRAVNEFISILHSSPQFMHKQKSQNIPHAHHSIDQGPYLNVTGGMVAPMGPELTTDGNPVQESSGNQKTSDKKINAADSPNDCNMIRRCLDRLCVQNKRSMWVLACVALLSSWPIFGSSLKLFFQQRSKRALRLKFKS